MMEHNQLGNLKPPLGEPEMAGPQSGGDRNEGNGGATARKGGLPGLLKWCKKRLSSRRGVEIVS